jgi:peptidyl-prolyl cis-trans isomerase C
MKRLLPLLPLVVVLAACAVKDPNDPKFIVAKGNGVTITRGQLTQEVSRHLRQMGVPLDQVPKEQVAQFERRVLDDLVTTTLLEQAAAKADLKDIDGKTKKAIADIEGRFPSKEEFDRYLTSTGLTRADFEGLIKKQTIIREFLESKFSKEGNVTEEQVKAFYESNPTMWKRPEMVEAKHVLIRVAPDASAAEKAAKMKEANDARTRVTKGEDFGKVASEVSEDPGSKAKGGELPPIRKGMMVPEFEKVAFSTKAGTVSPVFSTQYGYHFLVVSKHLPEGTATYDEVKDKIQKALSDQEKGKAAQAYVKQIRDDAKVEVKLPEPPAPAAPAPGAPGAPEAAAAPAAPAPAPAPAK